MKDWIDDFEYLLMPSAGPLPGYEKEYFAAYRCWRRSWEKFRSEVKSQDKLFSDALTNTDELGVLFYKGACVGLHAFRTGNLLEGTIADAAWFAPWSQASMDKLSAISAIITISSQFTIDPDFTGKNQVVRWKNIGAACTFNRFIHSAVPVLAGYLNLSRGMDHAAGARTGAIVLNDHEEYRYSSDVSVHAQPVAYTRESLLKAMRENNEEQLYKELWMRTRLLTPMQTTRAKLVA